MQKKPKYKNKTKTSYYASGGVTDAIGMGGLATGLLGGITKDPTMTSIGSGITSGLAFGPIGAAIGGGLGLVTGLLQKAAQRKQLLKDRQIDLNNMMTSHNQPVADNGILSFPYGGVANTPIQAEKYAGQKEQFILPDNTIAETNADSSHEAQSQQITDVLPQGTKVASARNRLTKKEWGLVNDITGGMLNMDLLDATAKKTKKNKISPADIVEYVKSKWQKKSTTNEFNTAKLNARNIDTATEEAFKFNKVLNPNNTASGTVVPKVADGGDLLNLLYLPDDGDKYDRLDSDLAKLPMYGIVPGSINYETYKPFEANVNPALTQPVETPEGFTAKKKKLFDVDRAGLYGTIGAGLGQLTGMLNQQMYSLPSTDFSGVNNMEAPRANAQLSPLLAAQSSALNALSNTTNYGQFAANAANVTANTQNSINNVMQNVEERRQAFTNQKLALWQQLVSQMSQEKGAYNKDKTTLTNAKLSAPGEFMDKTASNLRQYSLDKSTKLAAKQNNEAVYEALLKLYAGNPAVLDLLEGMKSKFNTK